MNKAQIQRLRERVTALCGPSLKVTLKDGSTRIVSSGDAIDLFLNGEGVKAESMTGHNGLLPGLLTGLAETE